LSIRLDWRSLPPTPAASDLGRRLTVNQEDMAMIHHLSIAARDPQHVAEVLAEFMGGTATRFPPHPGSWFAHQNDEHGTGVEVYPAGTELRPAGASGTGFAMTEPSANGYGATHFALSVAMSQDQIEAIARREGWQCQCCNRGGAFHVMEIWIENAGMIELLPPPFAAEYLKLTGRRVAQPA
jgi:hypothetical protein